jgi:integrase
VGLTRWLKGVAGKSLPGVTSHGLRHSFGSTAEDLGFSLLTIKALLGHAGSSVTEGYIHKVDSALVSAATRISQHIDETMYGEKPEKVVSLRKA